LEFPSHWPLDNGKSACFIDTLNCTQAGDLEMHNFVTHHRPLLKQICNNAPAVVHSYYIDYFIYPRTAFILHDILYI